MTTTKTKHPKGVTIGLTPTQDKPAVPTAVPAPAPALPVPEAFKNPAADLKPDQLRFAIELGAKFPSIVNEATALKGAAAEADAALGRMGQKYYGFCSALRDAKLNRRESSILLKGLGFAKNRVYEILKVSEVDQVLWDKFANKQIGFKATLALSNGGADDASDGDEVSDGGDEAEKKKKKKERKLPKEFQPPLIACLEDFGDSLKACSVKEPYVMRYENKEKRTYVLTIQPIDAE